MQKRTRTGRGNAPAIFSRLDRRETAGLILPSASSSTPSVPDWTHVALNPDGSSRSLSEILAYKQLDMHFQPIISLKKKAILGVEALVRPKTPGSGLSISPLDLFALAAKDGRTLELDRLCRSEALRAFSPMVDAPQPPLLFLNFESSVLDQGVVGSGSLSRAVRDAGLSPQDVVIEINESKVQDVAALQLFVEIHRKQGFLFALDDLGTGFSNLARITTLRPEILKLDRSLIMGISGDYYKQEVFKSLVGLGRRVGALILAEGVETDEELSTCVDLGADLVQGFFFGRPTAPNMLSMDFLESHLNQASHTQRLRAAERLGTQREEMRRRQALQVKLTAEMAGLAFDRFEASLHGMATASEDIECLYIIDINGIQVTDTIAVEREGSRPLTRLFYPAQKGADHSSKEYYYALVDGGLTRYTTEAYLSMASGKLCRTLTCRFEAKDGSPFLFCLDLNAH